MAVRDISAGEELSWSYTNPLWPRPRVQAELQTTWLFSCTCPLCQDPTELHTHYSQVGGRIYTARVQAAWFWKLPNSED